ncbi:polysaccharide pyruvyl transferase family protein [Candidatus Solirubrobacter pratensis]|uniref:polysaccharide pyruvyl transferase family protein n=1 Tax=Candidatus Solirubrobacter pratensis TaxID=1298857 RepID=UPI00041B698A|nr:polysaccharide pyruvyl transferase family protein [Candidatus Solirubrobacter pratensis]
MSRRVVLAGAFGQGNPGDEALLRAFAAALPDHVPVAASSAPAATAAEHAIPAVDRDDPPAVLRAVRHADAVVVAGGTVFKTLHPSCARRPGALLRRLTVLAVAAKAMRKPLALVGVGAGALESASARRHSRAIVQACDLLILRDEESASRLAAAGATAPFRVGADAAWTVLDDAPQAAASNGAAPVVVVLSHLAGGPELPAALAAGLAPLVSAGAPVLLQPWQPDDVELGRAVAALVDGARLVAAPAGLDAARDAFAGARLVIGLRFHSLVAAAAAGVPFVAYAHEPKLAGLARRLGQPAVPPGGPLAGTALAALAESAPPSRAAVARERELALAGFRLLRVLVAGGRTEEAVAVDGLALRPEEWLA